MNIYLYNRMQPYLYDWWSSQLGTDSAPISSVWRNRPGRWVEACGWFLVGFVRILNKMRSPLYKMPKTSVINIYTNAIVFYLVQYAFELFRIIVEIDKQAVFNITILLLEIEKKLHEFKILQSYNFWQIYWLECLPQVQEIYNPKYKMNTWSTL